MRVPRTLVLVCIAHAMARPTCTHCDAGAECGICLRLLEPDECPRRIKGQPDGGLPSCASSSLEPNRTCEADGACGTNDRVNNCNYVFGLAIARFDYYLRLDCDLRPPPPPSPPALPAPPSPPQPARPPGLPSCHADACDAGAECGYCLKKIAPEQCPRVREAVNGGLQPCEAGRVAVGELCEGDGPCGTNDATDNCDYADPRLPLALRPLPFDVYVRLACFVTPLPPPSPPLLPMPPAMPPLPSPPTFPECGQCDAGAACGYCLRALASDECPPNVAATVNGGFPPCVAGRVAPGQLCEGDGSCGTSDRYNNCGYRGGPRIGIYMYDLYLHLPCVLSPHVPPTPPAPPALPAPPAPPPPPRMPACGADECDAGLECGYCLRRLRADECPREVAGAVNGGFPPCNAGAVAPGSLCEGDGPCGTSEVVNNCGYTRQSGAFPLISFDYYLRVMCDANAAAGTAPAPAQHALPAGSSGRSSASASSGASGASSDWHYGDDAAKEGDRGGVNAKDIQTARGGQKGVEQAGGISGGVLLLLLGCVVAVYVKARASPARPRAMPLARDPDCDTPGLPPAPESQRPWRLADVQYRAADIWSQLRYVRVRMRLLPPRHPARLASLPTCLDPSLDPSPPPPV